MKIIDLHYYDIEYKTGTGTIVNNLISNSEQLYDRYGVEYSCFYKKDNIYRTNPKSVSKEVKRNLRSRFPVLRLVVHFLGPIIWMIKQRSLIRRELKSSDFVQVHDLFTAIGVVVIYPSALNRLIIFFHDNGNPTDMLKNSYNNWSKLEEIIIKTCHIYLLNRASRILYVSKYAFQYAMKSFKKYSDKFICLPNSVSLEECECTNSNQNTIKTVITVGTVSQRKRQLDLAKAFENAGIPVKLIVVGEGPLLSDLKDFARNSNFCQVQITGSVSRQLVNNFYSESHVYAMASLNEGLPMSVLEAMALSLPIVAIEADGISDIVSNDINGYLVHDLEELVAKINAFSIDELSKMGLNAKKTIIENHSLDVWLEKYTSSLK